MLEWEIGRVPLGWLGAPGVLTEFRGANVSPSKPARVAPASFAFMPDPQELQNLAVVTTSEPHWEQYMGAGFYLSRTLLGKLPMRLSYRLHLHRCPVRQHFRHAIHHFRRVVSKRHHPVRSMRRRVHQHQFIRFAPRLLAKVRINRDIPPNN